ncbi:hypothetical protein [Isoptericola sp. AK164]|uniref:hypothetical protein n=1 Tax=Isoptericola sp. AK164 TaxID=3024246 RepID=UPI002418452D|nr:hypothetical protein [Isoptericola sp. AK164]
MTTSTETRGSDSDPAAQVTDDGTAAVPRAAVPSVREQTDPPGTTAEVVAVARAWHELVAELDGDERAVERFATIWLQLLPRRLAACRRALVSGEDDAARVRLLTLHSSAVMLGLDRLAEVTWRCQSALDQPTAADDDRSARCQGREVIAEAQSAAGLVRAALGHARWSKR